MYTTENYYVIYTENSVYYLYYEDSKKFWTRAGSLVTGGLEEIVWCLHFDKIRPVIWDHNGT
jgi:hypothetical protein